MKFNISSEDYIIYFFVNKKNQVWYTDDDLNDYEIEILTEVISQLSFSLWYNLSDEDLKITHNSESIFQDRSFD